MKELIELTGQELAVQNITVSIYDIAKRFKKDHSKALKAFRNDIDELRPEQRVGLHVGDLQIEVSRGDKGAKQLISTYEVDIKTAVWFYTRYDAQLRKDIVDYAFEKLKESHNKETKALSKETKLIQTKLNYHRDKDLNSYDGWESASKLIARHNLNWKVSELLDAIETAGGVTSTIVERTVREPSSSYASKTLKGTIIFKEDVILSMIESGELE